MMSFKKNMVTVLAAIALVLLGSWIVRVPTAELVDGMTLVIATMVITLLFEDMWRKGFTDRSLLTWEYFIGALIVAGAVLMWLYASVATDMVNAIIRLGATFCLAILGGWWMAIPYKKSVQTADQRDEELADKYEKSAAKKWKKLQKKVNGSTKSSAWHLLADDLRYCLTDDTLDGDLDFSRPLCMIDGDPLTFDEAVERGVQQHAVSVMDAYINTLIKGLEE